MSLALPTAVVTTRWPWLRPPLVFGQAEADLFLTAFDEVLREMHAAS